MSEPVYGTLRVLGYSEGDLNFTTGISSGWGMSPGQNGKWNWHAWVWKVVDGETVKQDKRGHSTSKTFAVRDAQTALYRLRSQPKE